MKRLLADSILALVLLTLAIIIAVQSTAYDADFIAYELLRLNSPQAIGMSETDTYRYAAHTADYLRGSLTDPNLIVTLDGVERPFLNERESIHMQDVQQLFTVARYTVWALVLLLILWSIWAYRRHGLLTLLQSYSRGAGLAILIATLLALIVSQDFTQSFTLFHLLSFSNDLWQLNPATDLLINLLPERFFADAALRTAMHALGLLLLTALATHVAAAILRLRKS